MTNADPTTPDGAERMDVARLLTQIRTDMNVGKIMPEERGGGRAGHIYVRDDPQQRFGPDTKLVVVQGDGESPHTDTYQLGVFWQEAMAEAFAATLREATDE